MRFSTFAHAKCPHPLWQNASSSLQTTLLYFSEAIYDSSMTRHEGAAGKIKNGRRFGKNHSDFSSIFPSISVFILVLEYEFP